MFPFIIVAALVGGYFLLSGSASAASGSGGGGGGSGDHRGWSVLLPQEMIAFFIAKGVPLPAGTSASTPPAPKPEVIAKLDALEKEVASGAKPKAPPYVLKHDASAPSLHILGVEGAVQSVSGSGAGRVWLVSFDKVVEQQSEMQMPPPELAAMGLNFPIPGPVKTKVDEPAIGSIFAVTDSSFAVDMGK